MEEAGFPGEFFDARVFASAPSGCRAPEMGNTIQNIVQLRQLLAERFPNLRTFASDASGPTPAQASRWPTGWKQIDELLHGGLPKGGITELVVQNTGSGSALIAVSLLRRVHEANQWLALIDGRDSFDPAGLDNALLSRLLWVRCRDAAQAMKAADLLLRDGNLPVALLDLRVNPRAQLRRIPATTWYRLQRILEQALTALLVLTPWGMVSSAHARLCLQSQFTLGSLTQNTDELVANLKIELLRPLVEVEAMKESA